MLLPRMRTKKGAEQNHEVSLDDVERKEGGRRMSGGGLESRAGLVKVCTNGEKVTEIGLRLYRSTVRGRTCF